MNAQLNMRSQCGAALVAVMLFLMVLTILVISMLQSGLLETKMSEYYKNNSALFYAAERQLEKYEQQLAKGEQVRAATIIDAAVCGTTFYRVNSVIHNGESGIRVQSTFAKVGDILSCDPKPQVQTGRQSWRIFL